MAQLSLDKAKKLKSKKAIAQLFKQRQSINAYPVRLLWSKKMQEKESSPFFKVAFSVSKRKFKSAVDRNRIKRQLREAFRLEQERISSLSQDFANYEIQLMFLYNNNEHSSSEHIHRQVVKLLKRLTVLLSTTDS